MRTSYLNGRLRSFGHAFRGLKVLVQSQHNARIHTLATILVIAAGALTVALAQWRTMVLTRWTTIALTRWKWWRR